jgi:hypothetical protein
MDLNFNQAVLTTRYVLESQSPVVYVAHDHDRYWQFLGKEENLNEKDGRIISLGEMISLDPSIKDILWIQSGMSAHRHTIGEEWTTGVLADE